MKEPGYIYILESDVGYYKIGRTKDLKKRLTHFRVSLPFNVSLLHHIKVDDTYYYETWLHNYFSEKRAGGEWFILNYYSLNVLVQMDYQSDLDAFIQWIETEADEYSGIPGLTPEIVYSHQSQDFAVMKANELIAANDQWQPVDSRGLLLEPREESLTDKDIQDIIKKVAELYEVDPEWLSIQVLEE